jgi:hypothetical protein
MARTMITGRDRAPPDRPTPAVTTLGERHGPGSIDVESEARRRSAHPHSPAYAEKLPVRSSAPQTIADAADVSTATLFKHVPSAEALVFGGV